MLMGIIIIRADNHEIVPVSHQQEFIKRIIIPKGVVPGLLQCAIAQFHAHDMIASHKHETMIEIFYVVSGKLCLISNIDRYLLKGGDCFVVFQGTDHCLEILSETRLFYFNLETRENWEGTGVNE
jgi:mannose-6-phosphate isomerase-like protein (cupin superfamily)